MTAKLMRTKYQNARYKHKINKILRSNPKRALARVVELKEYHHHLSVSYALSLSEDPSFELSSFLSNSAANIVVFLPVKVRIGFRFCRFFFFFACNGIRVWE